ncbi:MAG: 30S ribosome-binding factor RbfA [Chthoniobacter sp.]|uniref:30S ribosome-binding factor RbfA n=1 Tax=Chthoniobacter sp. TaxID=2510640 RepID=UPI0032A3B818
MKHRLERVNELLKRELGDLLRREVSFEAALVTVQQVDITPDLKHAHVYISVMGNEAQTKAAMAKLHDSRISLQHLLSKRVVLKYTPHLHFKLDDTIERGTRIINLLESIDIPPDEPLGEPESESESDAK